MCTKKKELNVRNISDRFRVQARSAAVILLLMPFCGNADTARWANRTERAGAKWGDDRNWSALELPVSGADVALPDFDALPAERSYIEDENLFQLQRIDTEKTDKKANVPFMVNPVVGTLTGACGYTLQIDTLEGGREPVYYRPTEFTPDADGFYHRTFDVANPNGFLGFWEPKGIFGKFFLHPSESFVPRLNNLSSKNRPFVDVPGEGMRAEVGNLYDGGMLDKTGEGELSVESTDGNPTYFWLRGGSLNLSLRTESDLQDLFEKAALHLDASDAASLEKAETPDGVVVTKWNDVRGNGSYAFCNSNEFPKTAAHQLKKVNPPLLVENDSPMGLELVDFGVRNGESGRTNCLLKILPRLTDVKAAFYVADCPGGARNAVILGDTDSHQLIPGSDSSLYDAKYSDPAVRYADILINGKRTQFNSVNSSLLRRLHVFASDFPRNVKVGLLGSREYYQSTTGGSRIGEVLLFTNELTRAERMQIADYLYRRWISGKNEPAVSGVNALSGSAKIAVAEGKNARVGRVYAEKGLVKSGGGSLEISSLEPAGNTVEVSGGSVSFNPEGSAVGDISDVPADAYIWLSADDMGEDDLVEGTDYVKSWQDRRQGVDRMAVSAYSQPPHMARLKDSPFVPYPVVDFGAYGSRDGGAAWADDGQSAAWMMLPNWNTANNLTYDYFIVVRFKCNSAENVAAAKGARCLSSSDMSGYRDGKTLISSYYFNPLTMAAIWKVDGKVVDPAKYTDLYDVTNRFFVVSVSASTPFRADALAKDRVEDAVMANAGGVEIGEMIAFDRKLSQREHRATEAYLLKKWLNADHPVDTAVGSHRIKFAQSLDSELSASSDTVLRSLEGGNGNVVKRGAGNIKVLTTRTGEIRSLAVEEGDLEIGIAGDVLLKDALYHFDASDEKTFQFDSKGGITKWNDVRGNGIAAEADTDGLANVKPVLVEVETRPGVRRKSVDFGALSWTTNGVGEVRDASSMTFKKDGVTCVFPVKEVFCVFSDAHGSKHQSVICDVSTHEFNRGFNGELFLYRNVADGLKALRCTGVVANSRKYIDGVKDLGLDKVLPDGFHSLDWTLWQYNVDEPSVGWNAHRSSAFARWTYRHGDVDIDRRGGLYISESFAFDRVLTTEERARLQRYIDVKWFGATVTNYFDVFSVAFGSKLSLVAGANVVSGVSELSGSGTIVAPGEIVFGGTLKATVGNGLTGCLNIDGTISFNAPVRLVVTVDSSGGRLAEGDCPVLTAKALNGFDASGWTVVMPDSFRGKANVVKKNDGVYLRITKRGMTVIVR